MDVTIFIGAGHDRILIGYAFVACFTFVTGPGKRAAVFDRGLSTVTRVDLDDTGIE